MTDTPGRTVSVESQPYPRASPQFIDAYSAFLRMLSLREDGWHHQSVIRRSGLPMGLFVFA